MREQRISEHSKMNDEELLKNRTALLKEITKVGKERDWRRAEALPRSLGSGRRTFNSET